MQLGTAAGHIAVLSAIGMSAAATGVPAVALASFETSHKASSAVSRAELLHWLATTDFEVNWIGEPINPLGGPSEDSPDASTTVVWCMSASGNDCISPCNAYSGPGNICITQQGGIDCLLSTSDEVTYCTANSCGGTCLRFADCPVSLNHGFCFTPNISSILVPSVI
ncbi:hypothetical protein OH77DRAFT_1424529 [Trametes cingulata]|nr:hypothetical protein OH77DRAFT_1424529 [Trametes cingulata]